ncbi:MAG TPA: respiratory nitrate reductase subunit gamma [Spirochaetales bacterium]|nr:respiratory nitrate reductase subunit gamma [Spirochaetales bacterium]
MNNETLNAVSAASAAAEAISGASTAAQTSGGRSLLSVLEYFITVPMVYLALLFCIVAVCIKVARMARSRGPYSLAIYPRAKKSMSAALGSALGDALGMRQIRKRKPVFWLFLMAFHTGLILLVLGHLDILPSFNLVNPESRHMLGKGLVGVLVTVPAFYFLVRRFRGMDRHISVPSDYLLLLLLIFTMLLGDLMSWGNSWTANGFVMTKADFALYFDGLSRFTFADPRSVLPGSHYHFVVVHVLLANLFFIILPFSKIVHAFFSVPLNAVRRLVWTSQQAKN